MRYELLGPLRVVDGGEFVDVGGPRQRRVLAVLLATAPDGVSVDRLIDEVWGDDPPSTAAHVISTYVSNLKGVLDGRIESDGRRYRLIVDGDDSDAAELERTLEGARTLVEIDPAAALDQLDVVLSLRRGRPFEGVADDALSVQVRAGALEERWLQAMELRLQATLELGRHDDAVTELEGLVRSHPLRERFSELLMVALYRSERQAQALAVYRKLRERLLEELGLDPSPALQELEERILLQDPGLDLRPPHNLPTPISTFVGRVDEMGAVSKELQAHRLVTLIGVGGVGKTRIAREVALSRLDDFTDGVWWVDLAPVEQPDGVLDRITRALGVSGQPGLPLDEVLRRYLAHRTLLLVLDNCEHVAAAAGQASAAVLGAGSGVKVMATSRRALEVSGEVRCEIPPMSLPDPNEGHTAVGVSDAERLFTIRAEEADSSFRNVPTGEIARICLRLDGIPLAIEMAAARTRVLSSDQISERLEAGSGLLALPEVDRPSRQRTMEDTIGWSYRLLTVAEQRVFERLGVFTGAFDLDAAEAVAGFDPIDSGSVLDVVGSLVDSSMLSTVRTDDTVRYRMLQTLREYAANRLHEAGDGAETGRRHAHHHVELLRGAGRFRMTPEFTAIADRLDALSDDLIGALEWLLEHEPDRAIDGAAGLTEYWSRRGLPALAYHYGRRMLEAAPHAGEEARAEALLCASFGAALSGDFELAASGPAEAVELSHGAGWQTRLWAYHALGNIGTILGDLDTVERAGYAMLEICDAEGLRLPRAYGSALLGHNEFFRGRDVALAGRYFDEAIEGMRALGDFGGMKIYGLITAGAAAALRGDYPLAERYANEAIGLPGTAWTAAAYIVLGAAILYPQGQLERAGKVLARGTRLAYEAGTEIWMRSGFLFVARHAAALERWEPAARLLGACEPNLPAWDRQARSDLEAAAREKLGDEAFGRLSRVGASASPEQVLAWIGEVLG